MAIDIIFAIVAGYGFYLGYSRGIIQTVFALLSLLIGLMAAFRFAQPTTEFLENAFQNNNPLMFIAGFLLTFVATMLMIRLLARGLEGFLETININIFNQIAGGILMSGIMILAYSVILWFFNTSGVVNDEVKEKSFTYVYLKEYPTYVWDLGKQAEPVLKDFYEQTQAVMDRLQEMSLERQEANQ
ncbi:MAG: CvpA family protein [Bacteroidota bacterium]